MTRKISIKPGEIKRLDKFTIIELTDEYLIFYDSQDT